MTTHPQHKYSTTALDLDLLATPFGVQTNWHVITGAPSCGKTTLINLLAEEGYQTVAEGARQYIEHEVARGRTIGEIQADPSGTQHAIKNSHREIERGLSPAEFLFLDRAVPDCLGWHRVFGLDPNEFLLECFQHRYASVFFLDPLPLDRNGFRYEDETMIAFLDKWHPRDYAALGYEVVRIPVIPPGERLAFLLENLASRGYLGLPV
jgi:predicted ATPase